jgi:hypothetical protein
MEVQAELAALKQSDPAPISDEAEDTEDAVNVSEVDSTTPVVGGGAGAAKALATAAEGPQYGPPAAEALNWRSGLQTLEKNMDLKLLDTRLKISREIEEAMEGKRAGSNLGPLPPLGEKTPAQELAGVSHRLSLLEEDMTHLASKEYCEEYCDELASSTRRYLKALDAGMQDMEFKLLSLEDEGARDDVRRTTGSRASRSKPLESPKPPKSTVSVPSTLDASYRVRRAERESSDSTRMTTPTTAPRSKKSIFNAPLLPSKREDKDRDRDREREQERRSDRSSREGLRSKGSKEEAFMTDGSAERRRTREARGEERDGRDDRSRRSSRSSRSPPVEGEEGRGSREGRGDREGGRAEKERERRGRGKDEEIERDAMRRKMKAKLARDQEAAKQSSKGSRGGGYNMTAKSKAHEADSEGL